MRTWHLHHSLSPNKLLDLLVATGGEHVRALELEDLQAAAAGTVLLAVSMYCKCVYRINIDTCFYWSWAISAITKEAQSALEELTLVDCSDTSPVDLSQMSFPKLERLQLRNLTEVEDGALVEPLSQLLAASPNLRDLRVNDVAAAALHTSLDLLVVRERMRALHTLMLYPPDGMTAHDLASFYTTCRDLQSLFLTVPLEDGDAVVQGSLNHCSQICCLGLTGPITHSHPLRQPAAVPISARR